MSGLGGRCFEWVEIVPTLCVGMHPVTLRVTIAHSSNFTLAGGTRSVPGGISTQSVGTIIGCHAAGWASSSALSTNSCTQRSRSNEEGGSCTRVDRPVVNEPGIPEGIPRTTAATRYLRHEKTPGIGAGRSSSLRRPDGQIRSLNWQRRAKRLVSEVPGGNLKEV